MPAHHPPEVTFECYNCVIFYSHLLVTPKDAVCLTARESSASSAHAAIAGEDPMPSASGVLDGAAAGEDTTDHTSRRCTRCMHRNSTHHEINGTSSKRARQGPCPNQSDSAKAQRRQHNRRHRGRWLGERARELRCHMSIKFFTSDAIVVQQTPAEPTHRALSEPE